MRLWRVLLLTLLAVEPAGPALADTVADKPRLAVAIANAPAPFLTSVGTKLNGTRRFDVVDGAAARAKLKAIPLNGGFTLENARKARAAANVELLVDGKYEAVGGQVKVTVKLFDFRTGEFSRDLGLLGDAASAESLADQLVGFVRHADPLRCLVKDIDEDQIILDLGAADGITAGSLFRVFRHPLNMKPRELGTVRVTSVQPFASRAEAEVVPAGTVFERGDVLVEQTSGLLFK
ncbi:MAG: hypothetical protein VKS61_05840 [Candidatus Sericytochromatia bacterium]|nr:hypothetical protein [Candidatus Sericytochromatia bacterium]